MIISTIIGSVASAGVGQVMSNLVVATTPDNLNQARKVLTVIGGAAISGTIGKVVADAVENQINDIGEYIKMGKELRKEKTFEKELNEMGE